MAKGYIVTVEIFVSNNEAETWKDSFKMESKSDGARDFVESHLPGDFGYEVKNVRKIKQ